MNEHTSDDAELEAQNEAIRKGTTTVVAALGAAAIITGAAALAALLLFGEGTPANAIRLLVLAAGGEPAGMLAAFGAVAIASAVALSDSARRMEALEEQYRRLAVPGDPDPALPAPHDTVRRLASTQLFTILELLFTGVAAGVALAFGIAFAAVNPVAATVSVLLAGLLVVETARHGAIFQDSTALYIRPTGTEREGLHARLAALQHPASARVRFGLLRVGLAALFLVLLAIAVGVLADAAGAVLTVAVGVFVALLVALARGVAESALLESGTRRWVTIWLVAVGGAGFLLLALVVSALAVRDSDAIVGALTMLAALTWLVAEVLDASGRLESLSSHRFHLGRAFRGATAREWLRDAGAIVVIALVTPLIITVSDLVTAGSPVRGLLVSVLTGLAVAIAASAAVAPPVSSAVRFALVILCVLAAIGLLSTTTLGTAATVGAVVWFFATLVAIVASGRLSAPWRSIRANRSLGFAKRREGQLG